VWNESAFIRAYPRFWVGGLTNWFSCMHSSHRYPFDAIQYASDRKGLRPGGGPSHRRFELCAISQPSLGANYFFVGISRCGLASKWDNLPISGNALPNSFSRLIFALLSRKSRETITAWTWCEQKEGSGYVASFLTDQSLRLCLTRMHPLMLYSICYATPPIGTRSVLPSLPDGCSRHLPRTTTLLSNADPPPVRKQMISIK